MEKYRIDLKRIALKEIKKFPQKEVKKIFEKIGSLALNPRPSDCTKLTGQDRYRIRVGQYRIMYSIEDDVLVVYIVKVGHRKDVYRK